MERIKHVGDATVISLTIANIMNWLPVLITIVSGLLGIIWMTMRIYQTWHEIKRTLRDEDSKS